MTINQTYIYKYQHLINIIESIEWSPTYDSRPKNLRSIPFLNPHENHVITSPVSADSPYFIAYKYSLSKHSHNEAIEMLKKNPQLVDLDGLIENPNPKIAPLLEQFIDQFDDHHRILMCDSNNTVILEFLEKHIDKIFWSLLSANKHEIAIRILKNNPHNINFMELSGNPSGIEIIKQHMDLIDWQHFSSNPHPDAIQIIKQHMDLIDSDWLCLNTNPDAIRIIEQNEQNFYLDYMSWSGLSQNPSAIHILLKNPHLIDFYELLYNPSAIAYIEANATQIDNINCKNLLFNPNGLSLFEKLLKQGHISQEAVKSFYYDIVRHDSFFDLDYQEMSKKRSEIIYSELLEKAFHPSRVSNWLDYHCKNGGTPEDFEM